MTPPEENADLPDFTPESAHLLLQGVYGDYPHQNGALHLKGGVVYDALLKLHWRCLAAQLSSWYNTPSGVVGCRFTVILASEWWGVLVRTWNSERPLVFAHSVLTKMLGFRKARDIWTRITRWMDIWERGLHVGLVGDTDAEGDSREGRASSGGEE